MKAKPHTAPGLETAEERETVSINDLKISPRELLSLVRLGSHELSLLQSMWKGAWETIGLTWVMRLVAGSSLL